jgi:tetratricopeptide (TPR) repeat protein
MKNGIIIFLSIFLFSCGNNNTEETDSLLKAAPYTNLTDSISLQPKNGDLYYRRAALLLQNDQLGLAEKDLKTAWSLSTNEQYALGVVNVLRRKNVDSAIYFIDEALKKLPNSIALKISQARGYQQKGNVNQAIAVCDEIINVYPGQLDALQLKAEVLQAQNKSAEAVATLEKAYAYGPGDAELAHSLAFAYAETKNPKVLSLTDSLIKADVEAKHAEPYYFKGVYYANIGNDKQAVSFFDRAIQHDFYFLDAYMEKGNLYYEAKNYKDALSTFQLAARVSPTFADAYYWSGKSKEAMGNKAEAKLDYQRAYGLDKSMKEAKEAAESISN